MTDDNEQAQQHFDTDFCLVGNISSALTALITQSNYAFHEAKQAIHLSDLVFLVAIAFLPHVVLRFVNNHILNRTIRRKNPLDFIDTAILEPLCKFTCQIGQLGLLTYFGEVFIVFLSGLGVSHLEDKPKLLASFVYSVWAAKTLSNILCVLLSREFPTPCSQKMLVKRFADAVIYLITTLLFLDVNHVDIGTAMHFLLTLSGVSSVIVGLALKDPVTDIVQGTHLLLTNKFSVGNVIQLSNQKCGTVIRFEWTQVILQRRR